MKSLHCILAEPTCCSGSDLAGTTSGVACVEQSVGVVVGQMVEAIEMEHYCVGASVEILNNLTMIHRDYPDYTLLRNTCIIHNLLYVDHQFCGIKNNETSITCAH